jgi:hypothetical protein
MHDVAESPLEARRRFAPSRRKIALTLLGLVVAAGLVAAGRWTAPTTTMGAQPLARVAASCGTVGATVMPSPACRRALEQVYLGTSSRPSSSCGTIAPSVMPSPACQRALEQIFRGAPLTGGS